MAYSFQTVTALTDVPAAVAAIAAANGWTVDVTVPSAPIFTLPTITASIQWRLTAAIVGYDQTLTWAAYGSAVPTSSANVRSPKMAPASGTNPVVQVPSKVHVFISPGAVPSASPFLVVVLEYTYATQTIYRHLYLGSMEKMGNYTGGEIVSSAQGVMDWYSVAIDHQSYAHTQDLFRSRSSVWSSTQCGGVNVNHGDNPNQWRKFTGHNSSNITSFPADSVLGGFGDGINDGLLVNGECAFAGHNPLVPINLYASKPVSGDTNFVPIGRPPGVRLINMRNFDPGSQITIGGVTWRVFPGFAKRAEHSMPSAGSGLGYWRTFETSCHVGYAYREN